MKLLMYLVACCFVLKADSQSDFWARNGLLNYNPPFNPDQIYFADNRPSVTSNTQRENPSINGYGTTPVAINIGTGQFRPYQNNVLIQPSVETSNREAATLVQQSSQSVVNKNGVFQAQAIRPEIDSVDYAVTNFGLNLFKQIVSTQSGNTVVSPFSITTSLALLQQGATGSSLDQITGALQLAPVKSAEAFRSYIDNLKTRRSQNILRSVNNMFVAETFNVNPDFERVAKSNFRSDVTLMQFARPELAVQRINNWVAAMTNGKIENLLSRDAITQNSQLVLVNAVYFKGLWQIPFRTALTKSQPFQLKGGRQRAAQFMQATRTFRTGIDPSNNATVISLPFEKDQYSLLIVLPDEHSNVDTLISSLTVDQLITYQNYSAIEVDLQLPKFTVKADTDLEPVFNKMGISNIFSNRAELFGLGTFREFSPQISSALHSAVLTIDETGGSAAAATSFTAVALSFDFPTVVKVNRPFLAVLWDSTLNLPMFMAKIEDPAEE